jgi:DNA-binding beta-propeller fold protein YncE
MFIDPLGRVFARHEGEFPLAPVRDLIAEAVARFDAAGQIDRTPLPLQPIPKPGGPLRFPGNVLADAVAGRLFVGDTGHDRILVADFAGNVTMAIGVGEPGFADGPPAAAKFNHPRGMALGPGQEMLYVADEQNHAIRAVDLVTGRVTTVAGTGSQATARQGGPALTTALSSPSDVAFLGDTLWIAMGGIHQVWTLDLAGGTVAPAAGTGAESIHDGPLAEATFAQPSGLTATPDGVIYVADSESSAVRRVDPRGNRVRRVVGRGLFVFGDADGTGDAARLQHPLGIVATTDTDRPVLYVADTYNHKIKRIDPATRRVTTCFGTDRGFADGDAATARFWEPSGLSVAGRRLYVADTNNHAIRVADLDTQHVETVQFRE